MLSLHAFYCSYTLFYIFVFYICFIVILMQIRYGIFTFKLDNDRSSVETSRAFTVSFYFKKFVLRLKPAISLRTKEK